MTDKDLSGIGRTFTRARAVTFDAVPLPTPEIRALARADIEVHAHAVASFSPVAQRFSTLTDERTASCIPCTPAILAQTVWAESLPAVLIGWGSATWDVFTPALTRGIARVDMQKVARLAWPDDDVRDPVALAKRTGFDRPTTIMADTTVCTVADRVQAIADLFGAVITLVGDSMVARAAALAPHARQPWHGAVLGNLAGDPRLEALVLLSAEIMPPVCDTPCPWDDDSIWFGISGEDLAWYADDDPNGVSFDSHARDEARAEIARRQVRDTALLQPRGLLRLVWRD